jgi:putative FmdB family regulatory protein
MLYNYRCSECGVLEVDQNMKEDALSVCPQCSGSSFYRIVSGGTGTHFKGKGFYKNDYARTDSSFNKYAPREEGTKKFY